MQLNNTITQRKWIFQMESIQLAKLCNILKNQYWILIFNTRVTYNFVSAVDARTSNNIP